MTATDAPLLAMTEPRRAVSSPRPVATNGSGTIAGLPGSTRWKSSTLVQRRTLNLGKCYRMPERPERHLCVGVIFSGGITLTLPQSCRSKSSESVASSFALSIFLLRG